MYLERLFYLSRKNSEAYQLLSFEKRLRFNSQGDVDSSLAIIIISYLFGVCECFLWLNTQ